MGTSTDLLELYKPEAGEPASTWTVEHNSNMDKIDLMFDRAVCDDTGVTIMSGAIVTY